MPFKKGVSGNPGGISSHQKRLWKKFYLDAYKVWQEKGIDSLQAMARDDPSNFCKMIAGAMPKSLSVDVDVKETKVLELGVVLTELLELSKKLGIDTMKELPHDRVIEHKEIKDDN